MTVDQRYMYMCMCRVNVDQYIWLQVADFSHYKSSYLVLPFSKHITTKKRQPPQTTTPKRFHHLSTKLIPLPFVFVAPCYPQSDESYVTERRLVRLEAKATKVTAERDELKDKVTELQETVERLQVQLQAAKGAAVERGKAAAKGNERERDEAPAVKAKGKGAGAGERARNQLAL